ncbi:Carbonic Anhydrase 5A [Manis pentadactyla]|nr:Carbonic Anhydrase 5A [Manis pentadactyla]
MSEVLTLMSRTLSFSSASLVPITLPGAIVVQDLLNSLSHEDPGAIKTGFSALEREALQGPSPDQLPSAQHAWQMSLASCLEPLTSSTTTVNLMTAQLSAFRTAFFSSEKKCTTGKRKTTQAKTFSFPVSVSKWLQHAIEEKLKKDGEKRIQVSEEHTSMPERSTIEKYQNRKLDIIWTNQSQ